MQKGNEGFGYAALRRKIYELKEKYPLYPVTKKAIEANEKVKNINKNDHTR